MSIETEYAFIQNGRPVRWHEVTTEDLRVTVARYSGTAYARLCLAELNRRGIKS